jgi:hypothetical protein
LRRGAGSAQHQKSEAKNQKTQKSRTLTSHGPVTSVVCITEGRSAGENRPELDKSQVVQKDSLSQGTPASS